MATTVILGMRAWEVGSEREVASSETVAKFRQISVVSESVRQWWWNFPRGPPKTHDNDRGNGAKKRPITRWDPAPPTAPKPIATRDCKRTQWYLMAVWLWGWHTDRCTILGNKIASGPPNRSNRVPNLSRHSGCLPALKNCGFFDENR